MDLTAGARTARHMDGGADVSTCLALVSPFQALAVVKDDHRSSRAGHSIPLGPVREILRKS